MKYRFGIFRKQLPIFSTSDEAEHLANQICNFITDNELEVSKDKLHMVQWDKKPGYEVLLDHCYDVVFGYYSINFRTKNERNLFLLTFSEYFEPLENREERIEREREEDLWNDLLNEEDHY